MEHYKANTNSSICSSEFSSRIIGLSIQNVKPNGQANVHTKISLAANPTIQDSVSSSTVCGASQQNTNLLDSRLSQTNARPQLKYNNTHTRDRPSTAMQISRQPYSPKRYFQASVTSLPSSPRDVVPTLSNVKESVEKRRDPRRDYQASMDSCKIISPRSTANNQQALHHQQQRQLRRTFSPSLIISPRSSFKKHHTSLSSTLPKSILKGNHEVLTKPNNRSKSDSEEVSFQRGSKVRIAKAVAVHTVPRNSKALSMQRYDGIFMVAHSTPVEDVDQNDVEIDGIPNKNGAKRSIAERAGFTGKLRKYFIPIVVTSVCVLLGIIILGTILPHIM